MTDVADQDIVKKSSKKSFAPLKEGGHRNLREQVNFFRLSSCGESKVNTAPKDKNIWCSILRKYGYAGEPKSPCNRKQRHKDCKFKIPLLYVMQYPRLGKQRNKNYRSVYYNPCNHRLNTDTGDLF